MKCGPSVALPVAQGIEARWSQTDFLRFAGVQGEVRQMRLDFEVSFHQNQHRDAGYTPGTEKNHWGLYDNRVDADPP
jgi:hypothetical protein